MKRVLFVSVFMLFTAFSFNNFATDEGWYMSGNIGIAIENDSNLGSFNEAELEDIIGEDVPAGSTASLDMTYDMGYTVSAAVGYDFGNYRFEGELGYLKNDFDKIKARVTVPGEGSVSESIGVDGDISNLVLMFNGYYDFMEGSAWRPYLTAGIGYAKVDVENDDDTVFAYQAGAGLSYQSSEAITWDLRYRYMATSDPEISGIDVENSNHSVTLGLRFYF